MRCVKTFFLIIFICSTQLGCKKDVVGSNCQALKNAVLTSANEDLKKLVNAYISQLASQAYTAQNMNTLALSFSNQCSINTQVFCFDCITTFPSMSEIQITVTSTQPGVSKVADISYTPDSKMTCVQVHD
jgi:hypothetical protein